MKIVITCGDVNGIGPEIIAKSLLYYSTKRASVQFAIIAPERVLQQVLSFLHYSRSVHVYKSLKEFIKSTSSVSVYSISTRGLKPGYATKYSGQTALEALEVAAQMLRAGHADALVTAPISKEAIHLAGSPYPGHTEMLADWFTTENYAMMFHSSKMIGGLLTIHEPLARIERLIKSNRTIAKLFLMHDFLVKDLALNNPEIAVLGVNPHAGENGAIGKTDIWLKGKLESLPFPVSGPFPADGFFGTQKYKDYNCIVSPYHDQLLVPFKLLTMDSGVNVTAGLPIVRTSPDHGTAYGIVGKNIASPKSMIAAIDLAIKIVKNRNHHKP